MRLALKFEFPPRHCVRSIIAGLAILLGSILIVTGPTVIVPLLRHVRPIGTISSIIKWEGIVIDPVGAILAVLVFQVITGDSEGGWLAASVGNLLKTIGAGTVVGLAGAWLLKTALKRYLFPDLLQNSLVLITVIGTFVAANLIRAESGLLSVTLMGFVLANQKAISIERIVQFKEDLRVLLISILFIVLSARLRIADMECLGWSGLVFLGVLVLIARPAAVAISTVGSRLGWKERLFLGWMAPRGIVAAAVSSVFALELVRRGYPQAEQLMPLTFLVIIATVTFYSLTAGGAARYLGLSQPNPQGFLIVGAHNWGREIGLMLQSEGLQDVLLVDNNFAKVQNARMAGLRAIYGSAFDEKTIEQCETSSVGRLLALTSSDNLNRLATTRYSRVLESGKCYQLQPQLVSGTDSREPQPAGELAGRILFDKRADFDYLSQRFLSGAVLKKTRLSEEFDFETFQKHYGGNVVALFLIDREGQLEVFTTDEPLKLKPGMTLISLVNPTEETAVDDAE